MIGVGFSESGGGEERRNMKKGPCQGSDGKLGPDPGPEPQSPLRPGSCVHVESKTPFLLLKAYWSPATSPHPLVLVVCSK